MLWLYRGALEAIDLPWTSRHDQPRDPPSMCRSCSCMLWVPGSKLVVHQCDVMEVSVTVSKQKWRQAYRPHCQSGTLIHALLC
jgi:hypothetical protein